MWSVYDVIGHLPSSLILQFQNRYRRDFDIEGLFGHHISKKTALNKLKSECEKIKTTMLTFDEAKVDIDSLYDGKKFTYSITKQKFFEVINSKSSYYE